MQTPTGAFKLAKDPRLVQEKAELSESESEGEEGVSVLGMTKDILEEALQEEMKELYQTTPKTPPRSNTPITEPAARKRKRKPTAEWDKLLGSRSSTRERQPTEKARAQAVGAGPDYPTDKQARNSPLAAEWAKARGKERAQLENIGCSPKSA